MYELKVGYWFAFIYWPVGFVLSRVTGTVFKFLQCTEHFFSFFLFFLTHAQFEIKGFEH